MKKRKEKEGKIKCNSYSITDFYLVSELNTEKHEVKKIISSRNEIGINTLRGCTRRGAFHKSLRQTPVPDVPRRALLEKNTSATGNVQRNLSHLHNTSYHLNLPCGWKLRQAGKNKHNSKVPHITVHHSNKLPYTLNIDSNTLRHATPSTNTLSKRVLARGK